MKLELECFGLMITQWGKVHNYVAVEWSSKAAGEGGKEVGNEVEIVLLYEQLLLYISGCLFSIYALCPA